MRKSLRPRWLACLLTNALLLPAGLPAQAQQGQAWLPVRDVDLEVRSGSILDFSALAGNGVAGRHGWAVQLPEGGIGFERLRTPQKFFAASFAFSPASGGFPDRDEADRIIVQLRRTGYNAVRLQNVDANLMTRREADFDFDPVQLDRFDYFFSRLKAAGIYMVMDIMYLDNGAYGGISPHRWIIKHNLRQELYVDDAARAHWLRLLKAMLARTNKYTGAALISDPALLSLVLVNEGGIIELAYRKGGGFQAAIPGLYAADFTTWLRRRYGSQARLAEAWRDELHRDDVLDGTVVPPQSLRGRSSRHRDFLQYAVEKERDTYRWMHEQARALGYLGFTTAYNNWGFWQSDLSRAGLSLVDMHAYHVLPSKFVDPGSTVGHGSAMSNAARFVRELAGARQWGKPFTVTEYGQPFWNSSRRESVALVPSYAALQGWDLVTQFTETPIQLRYEKTMLSRRAAIHPFGIGADPVLRAGERLAALLYQRGDVGRSPSRLAVVLDEDAVLQAGDGMSQLSETVSRLSLLGGFGLQIGEAAGPAASRVVTIPAGSSSSQWKGAVANAATRLGLGVGENERITELKAAGLLPQVNRSDMGHQVFESDTGQLLLQARDKRFIVSTPRTVAIAVHDGPVTAGALTLSSTSVPVTLSLSAMDGQPLEASRRMLLLVLTDAQNSGMVFRDKERTTLERLGGLPVQLLAVQLSVTWKSAAGRTPKAWALSLNGERRDPVEVQRTPDGWQLRIDTARLPGGPTPYFEVSEE